MSRFTLDTDVRADLDAIWDHIAIENQNPVAASNQIEVLYDKFSLLATQPFLGEAREDLGEKIRMFVVRPYVILYRPGSRGIEVAQVVHSAQDIYAVFRRKV